MHFDDSKWEVHWRKREERDGQIDRERKKVGDLLSNLQIINRVFKVITKPRLLFII